VSHSTNGGVSRRELIKKTGQVAVASALAGVAIPHVHAAEDSTIKVALVGCGGRGTGAAENALSVKDGHTKLVAMADVFSHRLSDCYNHLKENLAGKVEVSEDHKFVSFHGYKDAMDCLRPGDVVILATPPAFRWVHFTYAISKGLHVFMEKPIAVDGPSTRRMLQLGEEAKKRNLKVAVGLMCRHSPARAELLQRIKDGQMGDILLLRAYRMHGREAMEYSERKPADISELLYQVQRFHSFLWASGGCYSDFLIHNIDECCWMKDAWPVLAQATGGRHYRTFKRGDGKEVESIDQNFDHYSVEYTFGDGTKLWLQARTINDCYQNFASYAHGTKGSAVISEKGHFPINARIYHGQNIGSSKKDPDIAWQYGQDGREEPNLYQLEWDDLITAIRQDKPYSEVERGAKASLVTAMGRMAAHTGQLIKYDDYLNSKYEFAPDVDKLTMDSPPPVKADKDGKYPVPEPGRKRTRERTRDQWFEY
jgi:predicted dehydrogenase